jgi:DNA-binding XRE family transcriptional regulator
MLTFDLETQASAGTSLSRAVLTKAVARAAAQLGLSKGLLARVLGLSPATITRIYSGDYLLDASRKEWEFALLLVRLFRSLDSIVADEASARTWLASENSGLNGRPLELITQTEGLVRVVHYLDASRAVV